MSRIHFSPEKTPIKHAVAASFDMCGFSKFCLGPTAHAYLNRYVASLFQLFDNAFQDWWRDLLKDTTALIQVPRPDFSKYTGDGALLLWHTDEGEHLTNQFCTSVVAALRHFQQQLPAQITQWEREWHTHSLPKAARFGIAIGPVHPLTAPSSATLFHTNEAIDFAGYPINLAVRLQDHCPEVGFIVHGPLHPSLDGLLEMRALKMKGSLDEPVYVFKEDYDRACAGMPRETKSRFAIIP
jgi:class 3 adenylate cyclase